MSKAASSSKDSSENKRNTRTRLVEAAAALFTRQGYAATGVKAVLQDASAPYGSLYHFFPGGKQELGVAAVQFGGARYRELIEETYLTQGDVVAATEASFALAAELLEASDYDYACPIAGIALEVASNDEPMREAAANAFESWLGSLEERFTQAGMTEDAAKAAAIQVFALLEGSLLLGRTTRTTEPLRTAGKAAAAVVRGSLPAGSATS